MRVRNYQQYILSKKKKLYKTNIKDYLSFDIDIAKSFL